MKKLKKKFEYICDKCEIRQPVPLPSIEKVKHEIEGELEHEYFECINCGEVYTIMWRNSKIRKIIEEQRTLRKNLDERKVGNRIKMLAQKIKKEERALRRRIGR